MSEPVTDPAIQRRSQKPVKRQGQGPLNVQDVVEKSGADHNLEPETLNQELRPVDRFIARFQNDPVWDTIADAIKSCGEDVELQNQD